VYDACGLLGVRYIGAGASSGDFIYVKDALGNITGIRRAGSGELVCHYVYSAFGETTVLDAGGQRAGFAASHIANVNPFRWKSYYYDAETGWYYINGRYYDPSICGFVSSDRPENLIGAIATPGALNRYGITIDNAVALVAAIWTIYTASVLYADASFERQYPWWMPAVRFWRSNRWLRIMVGIALIGIAILIAYASKGSALPALASIGVAIFTSVTQNTIIGALNGDCSLTGALDGLADGLVLAGVSSVLIAGSFGISSKISYALAKKAANPKKQGPFVGPIKPSDMVSTQGAVQPKMQGALVGTEKTVTLKPGHMLDRFGSLNGKYMTDLGTSADMLALPPNNNMVKTSLKVVKPLKLQSGVVAPHDFGSGMLSGGGIQYFAPNGVEYLILRGFLVIV